MSTLNRSKVSDGRGKVQGALCGFLSALALALGLQIGELLAIQFNQVAVAYGLGFAVIVAGAAGLILQRTSKPVAADVQNSDNGIIRSALEACKTNVMISDQNYNIVYMNRTMVEMMRAAEADLPARTFLPSTLVRLLAQISMFFTKSFASTPHAGWSQRDV